MSTLKMTNYYEVNLKLKLNSENERVHKVKKPGMFVLSVAFKIRHSNIMNVNVS